ncbi:MAG: hypothetical protein R2713_18120 [Ilumatobacteraceae bacterium]
MADGALRIGVSDAQRDAGCAGVAELLLQRAPTDCRRLLRRDRPDVAITPLGTPSATGGRRRRHRRHTRRRGADAAAVDAATGMRRAARAADQVTELAGGVTCCSRCRRGAVLLIASGGDLAEATATLACTLGWRRKVERPGRRGRLARRLRLPGRPGGDDPRPRDRRTGAPAGSDEQRRLRGGARVVQVHRARHERLRRRGADDEFLARLHGPAGLDIGARRPPRRRCRSSPRSSPRAGRLRAPRSSNTTARSTCRKGQSPEAPRPPAPEGRSPSTHRRAAIDGEHAAEHDPRREPGDGLDHHQRGGDPRMQTGQ